MLQPSFKLLIAGLAFVVLFGFLLLSTPEVSEASLWTRVVFFILLIPPPVCFGAGIALAFLGKLQPYRAGVVANVAALIGHGIASIVVLQQYLG